MLWQIKSLLFPFSFIFLSQYLRSYNLLEICQVRLPNESSGQYSSDSICQLTEENQFIFLQTENKDVTSQLKALSKVLSLKRFIFLQKKPKCVTTQMKALDEYIPNGTSQSCFTTAKITFTFIRYCAQWREFIFLQTKAKGVTTRMKTLIPNGTSQLRRSLSLLLGTVLSEESSFSCKRKLKVWPLKWKLSISTLLMVLLLLLKWVHFLTNET